MNVPRPAMPPSPHYALAGQLPPGYPPAAYAGYPPPPGYPPPGYPPLGYPPVAEGYPPPPPPVPEAAPEPTPVPEFEPEVDFPDIMDDTEDDIDDEDDVIVNVGADIDALFESDSDAVEDDATDEDEADPIAEMSQDDLDAMFEGEDEPPEIASMITTDTDDGDDGILDIDDIPDPEPLPASLTADMPDDDLDDDDEIPVRRRMPPKKKKKSNAGLIVSIILILFLSGIGGAAFFLRDMITQMVPEIAPIYEMIGLAPTLGEGVEIRNVSSERTSDGGVDFLIVSGELVNISGSEKSVPLVKAMLFDTEDLEIQSVVQEPSAAMISSEGVIAFSVTIEEPSPLARRVDVTFAPRPEAEMQ